MPECISVSQHSIEQMYFFLFPNGLLLSWKMQKPIHTERLADCMQCQNVQYVVDVFALVADALLLRPRVGKNLKDVQLLCTNLSVLLYFNWQIFCRLLVFRSKPVPSDCPEHRGIQEVPVGWRVSGLPKKTGCATAGNQHQAHHLSLAVHVHSQIWTG